jgi:D-arabinose 1-dehydrogenase-like Zn-dependent alcohol dehydrogenase
MLAAKFRSPHAPLSIERVEIPSPKEGHRLLEVKACGVCGSDLTVLKGEFEIPVGITMGHEIAGITEDGNRWAVYFASGCGKCHMCRKGWTVGCSKGSRRLGINQDGGFARFVAVPAENLIPIPSGVSFEAAAVATDAVATNLHALLDNGCLKAGETVAIFGIGGLGTAAIQIAKVMGARVIAISRSEGRRALAKSLGADEIIAGSDQANSTRGLNVDLALQLVPDPVVSQQAIASVIQGGRVILVGFTPRPFPVDSLDLILRQISVIGSRGMTRENIRTALDWIASSRLDIKPLLKYSGRLKEINEILDDFRAGKILRAVIHP